MKQTYTLLGVFRYEFRMQIRRPTLWLAFLVLAALFGVGSGLPGFLINSHHDTWFSQVVQLTNSVNTLFPIYVGVLLADRLARDKRTKVDELLYTMPTGLSTRLLGKYLGSTCATIIPMFLYYCIGVSFIIYQSHNVLVLPLAVETFAAIALPGLLFISAFSIACPAFMWVPLYQFLFVGYWFWGNVLSPHQGIPTLSPTLLTPRGGNMTVGFFGGHAFPVASATPLQGIESVLLLIGIAILVLYVLRGLLKWQQARQ